MPTDDPSEQGIDAAEVIDIRFNELTPAINGPARRGDAMHGLGVDVRDYHDRALRRESPRDRGADTATGSGDERDLVG
jgi:hypothetical protein